MADNITLPASGQVHATDDIGGVHYPRAKTGFGGDGSYTDVAPSAGLPTASSYLEAMGSASENNADIIGDTDVRQFRSLSVHLIGTWTAGVQLQGTNDGTVWVPVPLRLVTNGTAFTVSTTVTTTGIYEAPLNYKYVRLRTVSYTSGTVTAAALLSAWPPPASTTYLTGGSTAVLGYDGATDQRIKVTTGGEPHTVPGFDEVTGAITANGGAVDAGDVSAYRWAQIYVSGTWVGTLRFSCSPDGVNWFNLYAGQLDAPWQTPQNAAANGLWGLPINARYFRMYASAWTSGTANITIGLSAAPSHPMWPLLIAGAQSNTLADGASGFMEYKVGSLGLVWDGTDWDRIRNVTAVDGAGSTGLLAAGLMAYDAAGAVNRRLRCDANSVLQVRQLAHATATQANVTAATSSGTLLAAKATRVSASVFNDSTADLYLSYTSAASSTNYKVKVAGGGYWEMPVGEYSGAIYGAWSAANGAARVTEVG